MQRYCVGATLNWSRGISFDSQRELGALRPAMLLADSM